MPKLLCIYNICGIGGTENIAYYTDSLYSLLVQRGWEPDELKIAVSGCMSSEIVKHKLNFTFGKQLTYNWINESLPLTVTFNHTVKKCVEHFGEFDGYLYVDSGITFWDSLKNWVALRVLWDIHKSNPEAAITAAMPSNDDGHQWWNIQYEENVDYVFPVGKTTNLHCQIYSEEMRKAYNGRLHCDIFANDTSESVTSFLTAAMHRRFQITNKVLLLHNQSMDGASIGWRGRENNLARLFATDKTMDQRYHEGYEFGFGYEECNDQVHWLHDPDKFDELGNAKDPRLLEFLNKELFLKKEEFDYDKISHDFESSV